MYLQLLIILSCATLLNGMETFSVSKGKISNCEYKGYKPGGDVKNIGDIKAPKAVLDAGGLSAILGGASRASAITMHSLKLPAVASGIAKAAKIAAKVGPKLLRAFSKIGPALGPALGIFSGAIGLINDLTKPTPQDILDSVNREIEQLTKEVNEKLDRMKGYVDSAIITTEKELITREYASIARLWKNCITEVTAEEANRCQRDAFKHADREVGKFAVYRSKVLAGRLTNLEMRKLEGYLLAFRNYANIVLSILQALIDTYDGDDTDTGKSYLARYKGEMKKRAAYFEEYARAAVKEILKVHKGRNGMGVCPDTLKCGPNRPVKEGWFVAKHTADHVDCDVTIDEGTKQKCTIHWIIRRDGKQANYNIPAYRSSSSAGSPETPKHLTSQYLLPECIKYQNKNAQIAGAYWRENLEIFYPIWHEAATGESLETGDIIETVKTVSRWYCAVKINWRSVSILKKTTDLAIAQSVLSKGSSRNRQAIIPMNGNVALDPHTLSKSWSGGSMWWWDWNDIRTMQNECAKSPVPTHDAPNEEPTFALNDEEFSPQYPARLEAALQEYEDSKKKRSEEHSFRNSVKFNVEVDFY